MKACIFLLLLYALPGCFSTQEGTQKTTEEPINNTVDNTQTSQDDFKITEATSQRWSGGRQASGKGVIYIVKIEIENEGVYDFKTLWIGKRPLRIKASGATNSATGTSRPDDILLLRADRQINYDLRTGEFTESIAQAEPPVEFEGAAIIAYEKDGKKSYIAVPAFKQLEAINYP